MEYTVKCDYKNACRCGMSGLFQVVELNDASGKNCISLINQDTHYSSFEQLRKDIAKATNTEEKEVSLTML